MVSWFRTRRLQTQLILWTALIVVASVVVLFEVRMNLNLRMLEEDQRTRTETLIGAVDRTLMLAHNDVPLAALETRLRQFVEADQSLTRLDIVQKRAHGLHVLATTSSTPIPLISSIPETVFHEIRSSATGREMVIAQPVADTSYAIVAVASMGSLDRYEEINRARTTAFAGTLIVVLIILMHAMYQRMVSKRFDELLDGIRRAKEGNLAALLPADRKDEIGVIASTLNGLLSQVHSFNDELQRQVAQATDNLKQRNLALEETTRQMVAMQRQLLESERLATVGQMAATFAHEIGSPMSSLSAHVQLLLEDPRLTMEQRETLGIIREQIQSMVQIVNDLLRSARRGPRDFVATDVNDILQTVLRLVQAKLMSQNIEVQTRFQDVPRVRAYPLYLQEAFLNLINNASEAMPGGGNLEVHTWFDSGDDRVHIRIADTGPGIDPEVVEHMFEHFVTTKALGDGTGLGLGIVKDIVNSHRGTIDIARANGRGTAADITLPPDPMRVHA